MYTTATTVDRDRDRSHGYLIRDIHGFRFGAGSWESHEVPIRVGDHGCLMTYRLGLGIMGMT